MEKWMVYAKKANFTALGKKFNISPFIARVIRNRDLVTEEDYEMYLKCDLNKMYSPYLMKDMEQAVCIICEALRNHSKIRVIGDYDIDGVCSGYILTKGLKQLGAEVSFDVPDRIKDGYGMNERLIKQAFEDEIELIITCDNGIAASLQVEYAKSLGMKIIVTDHHEIPFTMEENEKVYHLPEADAVVDPKRNDCKYPFKDLCGAGIAYKLLEAVYTDAKKSNNELNQIDDYEFLKEYLVFAAIGTIGDIVDLVNENRIIAKNGLKIVNSDMNINIGLQALIDANNLTDKIINSYHIGFILGPCINAGGRLDTAKKAFSLFMAEKSSVAESLAAELKILNDERKDMTVSFTKTAIEMIKKDSMYENQKVLVVYLKDCHESLAGIIAGRIKDTFYKPTFVLTDSEDHLKGSGRSIETYSMFEQLVLADSEYEAVHDCHLICKFGGHKMAAGVTISKDKLNDFRSELNKNCSLTDDDLVQKIWIDIPLPFGYITNDLVRQLEVLEPFGKANEKPVFAEKNIRIHKIRILGKNKNVILMNLSNQSGNAIEAVCFEEEEKFLGYLSEKFSVNDVKQALEGCENRIRLAVTYYPEINYYNGNSNIRVVIKRYS